MIGMKAVYQVRKNAKPVVGKIADMIFMNNGIRLKMVRRVKGKFLSKNQLNNSNGLYVIETRWVHHIWLKPERILKLI
jgi:hypothetical protein